jgi:hypothetical protein
MLLCLSVCMQHLKLSDFDLVSATFTKICHYSSVLLQIGQQEGTFYVKPYIYSCFLISIFIIICF